jgi:Tfp pilus assembly PilM family ATPase
MGLQELLNPLKQSALMNKMSSALQTTVVGLGRATESPIAIDFGAGALKLLQVTATEPPSLVASACVETPPELVDDDKRRMAFQLEALPKLVKKCGFRGKRAVCSIPAWQTRCQPLQFPRSEGVPMGLLVEGAIAQQWGVDPKTLSYRFIEVGGDRQAGKVDVIVLSIERVEVDRWMEALFRSKLEPVGIHSEFLCTLHAFDHLHRREGDQLANTLYLDVGSMSTKVLIAHGRDLAFARKIRLGGHHLDMQIARQMGMTEGQARAARLALDQAVERAGPSIPAPVASVPDVDRRGAGGLAPGMSGEVLSQPSVAVGPAGSDLTEQLEILTDEVRMCLRHHAATFPNRKVERVVFVGGEARHRGLVQHIARALRLPAQVADPLARVGRTGGEPVIGVDMKHNQPGWTVALGLCLAPTDL